MKNLPAFFTLSVLLSGCNITEQDLAGVYVKRPSEYTIDSLSLTLVEYKPTDKSLGKFAYTQRFYDKRTGRLLFENKHGWEVDTIGNEQRIELHNFYLDEDENPENHVFGKYMPESNFISCTLPIKTSGHKLIVNSDMNVYYKKVN
jgi:hypothetical protein